MAADRIHVIVRSASLQVLRDAILAERLDLDCGGPRREADGGFTVHAYVPRRALAALRDRAGLSIDVDDAFARRAAERQREVGAGNRFAEARAVPRGPGRKTR